MIQGVIVVTAAFTVIYIVLILTYRKWFLQVPVPDLAGSESLSPVTSFSVIVPARNEEAFVERCLVSLLEQHYPQKLFEVILVDDHSTDNTAGLATSLQGKFDNLKIIRLQDKLHGKPLNSYKKKAIELGVLQATNDWIVTTDADCIVNSKWLTSFDTFIQQHDPVFVAAPVAFTKAHSFVGIFQSLDFMALQGITAAAVYKNFHSMCNGANLAYS